MRLLAATLVGSIAILLGGATAQEAAMDKARLGFRFPSLRRRGSRFLAAQSKHTIVGMVLLPAFLVACNQADAPSDHRVIAGDSEMGRAIIAEVACGVCHSIPGVVGANGIVGPPLEDFAQRQFIAGVLPNQPGVLVRWVREAPSLVPETGMPDMPLSEEQSRDVAAYLYTLR